MDGPVGTVSGRESGLEHAVHGRDAGPARRRRPREASDERVHGVVAATAASVGRHQPRTAQRRDQQAAR